jgi:pilus assembly protein CpaE
MGASGGTGVTSLCIQLAFDIAKRTKINNGFWQPIDSSVCLIDLDFETGSCASYLNIPPSLSISDVCGPAHRIDSSSFQALISQHESGLSVLTTPNALGANNQANPETILALLDVASQLYEHVIIDVPKIWLPWIAATIAGADHFALVGELNIASLHALRNRIDNIEKILGDSQSCEVILNKVERRSFRNSVRLSDAEKALKRSVSATICVDLDSTREAINCGVAVEVIRPEARYVKDVEKLSQRWFPEQIKKPVMWKDRRQKNRGIRPLLTAN